MSRALAILVPLSAMACAACGKVVLNDPGSDAQVPVPDAATGTPDAATDTPDARVSVPDARVPDAAQPPPPDARPACIEGDAQSEDPDTGACYMLFTTLVTWEQARLACAELGPTTHLITVTSAEEHALMVALAGVREVWMGATDAAVEGTFSWVTGEPFGFVGWAIGEPNDSDVNAGGEDCAILINIGDVRPGTWDDRACAKVFGYLCERN
jgi:hypothetical protein